MAAVVPPNPPNPPTAGTPGAAPPPLRDGWTRVMNWVSGLGFFVAILAAAFLMSNHVETSLTVSTAILAALIGLYWAARAWWVKIAKQDKQEVESSGGQVVDVFARADRAAQAMSTVATLVVTVQGIVLGLVFAFDKGSAASVTIKVGIGSLAFGVSVGLLLVSLCAFSLPGRRTMVVSALLFNLAIWNLSYGLVCIAATAIAP
ncbi:hypothetical protein [Streptomyces sp. NBC_00183]|uniref:hypothetical protein n=1 Tax=Streptomyces sp. NBC_00183 TaxID=2903633 RepID=UPI0022553880|nr:hypothetical protein [Streptomyces sp. NBC_00183]MCX5293627.1 hypothetical protein [Streptomyces sp. NBC_00183]